MLVNNKHSIEFRKVEHIMQNGAGEYVAVLVDRVHLNLGAINNENELMTLLNTHANTKKFCYIGECIVKLSDIIAVKQAGSNGIMIHLTDGRQIETVGTIDPVLIDILNEA